MLTARSRHETLVQSLSNKVAVVFSLHSMFSDRGFRTNDLVIRLQSDLSSFDGSRWRSFGGMSGETTFCLDIIRHMPDAKKVVYDSVAHLAARVGVAAVDRLLENGELKMPGAVTQIMDLFKSRS